MPVIAQVSIVLIAGYVVIAGIMFFAQRSLMYPAGRELATPTEAGLPQAQEILVTTDDGLTLRSWYIRPQGDNPTIIYFHGNAGTIADRSYKARVFARPGYGVLLAEYRGYGGNTGAPTEQGLYADAGANLAWLAQAGSDPRSWVLYGESLGTGVAAHMAREQAKLGAPVAGLILEAPFTSMADAAQHHYRFLPAGLLTRDRYDTQSKIAAIATPLLIVHGRMDRTVPQSHGQRLYDMASEPKRAVWLDGAGHNDVFDHGAGDAILSFVSGLGASSEK